MRFSFPKLAAMTIVATLFISAGLTVAQAPAGGGRGAGAAQAPRGGVPQTPRGGLPGARGTGGAAITPANQPAPRDDARHQDFLNMASIAKSGGKIDLLFVGDSITDGWGRVGRAVWEKNFLPLHPANFGIGGDRTGGVLWRMQNGELEGYKARLIVMMIGTNNLSSNPNDEIVDGNRLILEEFKKRQPQAKVLLLGIFPRDAQPNTENRTKIKDINTKLAKLADNKRVFFLDIGDKFLTAEGTISTEIMGDGLHPTAKGYEIWAAATIDKVKELMK